MFKILLFFMLIVNCLCYYDDNDDRIRVWEKVETNGINHKLYTFLDSHNINNCYEFLERTNLLRLRCYSPHQLFDVDVYIYQRNPVNVNFTTNDYNYPIVTAAM